MNPLPVIVPPDVRDKITDQVFYIADHSIDNALAWETRLLVAMNAIGGSPTNAIDEDASERAGEPLRKVAFEGTYLIHYRVTASAVEIVNVRHGARKPRRGEP